MIQFKPDWDVELSQKRQEEASIKSSKEFELKELLESIVAESKRTGHSIEDVIVYGLGGNLLRDESYNIKNTYYRHFVIDDTTIIYEVAKNVVSAFCSQGLFLKRLLAMKESAAISIDV